MIEKYFYNKEGSVYSQFKWKLVDVEIKDFATGKVIYEGHDLEFPEHYSQQACDIIASKYFYRDIDGKGTPEISLKQVVHRMVMFWTEALIDEGLLEGYWLVDVRNEPYNYYYGEAETFYDECAYTLLNQMWAPNSPQWFNTGINLAYGIKGESDDLYWCDDDGVHKSEDRYTRSQTSACFIIPVTDHLLGKNSITEHFVTETKLFKGGSGVGTNFSPLRAEGERLSSGGKSSGVMSFLLGLDRNAGAIKSGGTTRRAAKMVILDVDHPDIEDFIDWKAHEEKKARDLISLGYDGSLNGEAYQTVSGQNSNNSVRVTKEFMDKILGNDEDPMFELKGRKDLSLNRKVNAKEIWRKIAQSAWECGDPAVQFDDKYNEWHTAPNAGRINATNPCSEYAFIDNSACNLASINVDKFLYESGDFDYDSYLRMIDLCQLVLEASIHWGQFPTPEVAENTYKYRATGLGICNLGSVFLNKGIAYDSQVARDLAERLTAYLTAESFLMSSKMASEIGACDGFYGNEDALIDVINRMKELVTPKNNYQKQMFKGIVESIRSNGVRNMQVTVLAPTGTISLAMDCATTGIEPFFSHRMYKKCSDGSMMEISNPLVEGYLMSYNIGPDLDDPDYLEVQSYYNEHNTYLGCPHLDEYEQRVLKTANEIEPIDHVLMMGSMQKFITGSISKTVNLPNSATVEDIMDIYELSYTKGCKSISIYRDGSKNAQPLNVEKEDSTEEKDEKVENSNGKVENEIENDDELVTILDNPDCVGAKYKVDKWVPINRDELEDELKEIHAGDTCLSLSDAEIELGEIMNEYMEESRKAEAFKEEASKDLNYHTATSIESYKPQLFSNGIEDNQILVVVREGNTVATLSNKKICPIVEDDPFYSESNQKALKESLKQSVKPVKAIEDDKYEHILVPEEVSRSIERKKPDGIREGTTHTAKIGNVELYITVSYYDNGDLCEVFVSSDKEGTTTKGLLSSLSKAISHMLQYGIEPENIAQMLRNQQYEPQGHVERHPYIKMCNSISDLIARIIEFECGNYSRCQVKPAFCDPEFRKAVAMCDDEEDDNEIPDYMWDEEYKKFQDKILDEHKEVFEGLAEDTTAYTGSECPVCHSHRVVRNGACDLCLSCGSQSSCS